MAKLILWNGSLMLLFVRGEVSVGISISPGCVCPCLASGHSGWSSMTRIGVDSDRDWLCISLCLIPMHAFTPLQNEEPVRPKEGRHSNCDSEQNVFGLMTCHSNKHFWQLNLGLFVIISRKVSSVFKGLIRPYKAFFSCSSLEQKMCHVRWDSHF